MKHIKYYMIKAMAAMAAIATIVGCGNDDKDDAPKHPDLGLSVAVEDITTTTAKIKVVHNGKASDTWFGFVTTDVTTDESQLIAERSAASIQSSELHASRQYVTIVEELEPETTYKYIAVGYTAEGGAYGNIAAVEFTTLKASGNDQGSSNTEGMDLNEAWTVRYVGSKTIENLNYDHVVEVDSRDNNSYVIAVVTAEQWYGESLKAMSEALLVDMIDYLDYFNQTNGTTYTIADMLCIGDGIDAFDLTAGNYRALAIGITPTGALSHLYAVSEEFKVKEAVASEAYKSWLDNWNIVGQNNVSCPVTIRQNVVNKSVWMNGWEGFDDLAVSVEYDSSLNALLFHSQLVATDYFLGDDYGTADIYFFGGDDDGYYYDNQEGDYYIGICGILDDGGRAIVRYGYGVSGYPRFVQMFFMAYINGEPYALSAEEDIPSYVAIMDPVTEEYATPKPLVNRPRTPHKITLRKL